MFTTIRSLAILGGVAGWLTGASFAQDGYYFHDDFEDNRIFDGEPARWSQGSWQGGGRLRVEGGDVLINDCRTGG
jgi:hypothetical protein